MNIQEGWTSTQIPLWEKECVILKDIGKPFMLKDVQKDEHKAFVADFAAKFDCEVKYDGTTAIFTPAHSN